MQRNKPSRQSEKEQNLYVTKQKIKKTFWKLFLQLQKNFCALIKSKMHTRFKDFRNTPAAYKIGMYLFGKFVLTESSRNIHSLTLYSRTDCARTKGIQDSWHQIPNNASFAGSIRNRNSTCVAKVKHARNWKLLTECFVRKRHTCTLKFWTYPTFKIGVEERSLPRSCANFCAGTNSFGQK